MKFRQEYAYDSGPKTMLTVFLSIDGAILINWLIPVEKFNSGCFCEILEPLSEVLRSARGAGSLKPIVHFENATPHRSAATEIAFNFANSHMLLSHPAARKSVRVTSFYSAI
jgi:hypothetical protein